MRLSLVLGSLALATTLLAAAYLAFTKTYSGEACTIEPSGERRCVETSASLVEHDGGWVLAYLAAPPLITAGGLFALKRGLSRVWQWSLAAVLSLLCWLTLFSLGVFYLPAALLFLTAVALHRSRPQTP